MKRTASDSGDSQFSTHLALWILRFIYSAFIVFALPVSHLRWCESLHGGDIEGQKAFGFIIVFYVIGFVAASFYLLANSMVHHFLKNRPCAVAAADGLMFLMLGGLLAYMGVYAEYR